ncbi:hypothetical protein VCHA28O22_180035 [Vibrio chagasii]|nr:hypothetical protein VCHA28O22_180035 [Vibrio chagasii]CAH7191053.1 hypothetical protein VCHA38P217_180034 [Vibrio chagasii]
MVNSHPFINILWVIFHPLILLAELPDERLDITKPYG